MLKRAIHAFIKRWCSPILKQHVWDREYASGKWDFLDGKNGSISRDTILDVIERYATGGDVLDLGCGAGATGTEIAPVYRSYLGVDISAVAIAKANSLAQAAARQVKNSYVTGDILTFVPAGLFTVILFRESLYYFPLRKIEHMLARYCGFLAGDGVFIVRLHDRERYGEIERLIDSRYTVCERVLPPSGEGIILVFGPQPRLKQPAASNCSQLGELENIPQ